MTKKTIILHKLISISIFALLLIIACGKTYKDGPNISFRSAFKRVTGTWKVDKYYINDIDSTDEFYAKLGCEIEITNKRSTINIYCANLYLINCINNNKYSALWSFFSADKNALSIDFLKDSTFINKMGPIGSDRDGTWIISKLTNKELNLSVSIDYDSPTVNRTFSLKLKKIKP